MDAEQWILSAFFGGKSDAKDLKIAMDHLATSLNELLKEKDLLAPKKLLALQKIEEMSAEIEAFLVCLTAQDTRDEKALQELQRLTLLKSHLETLLSRVSAVLQSCEDSSFSTLLKNSELQEIAFSLNEKREQAKRRLSPDKEAMIHSFSVDGYHGWYETYATLIGKITIPFQGKHLSIGQAENLLHDKDRGKREEIYAAWTKVFVQNQELFAQILNHLGGFRLEAYRQRGWDDPLQEPLEYNRMSKETLDAMWRAASSVKPLLKKYLQRKKSLQGLTEFSWNDVELPLYDMEETLISFSEAQTKIYESFSKKYPSLAHFSQKAFSNRWIEAEDRPFKRPGGFCVSFPHAKESRIFMTFGGTRNNVSTLAHELGHAYHNECVHPLPYLSQQYRMNIAETASTLAEQILAHTVTTYSSPQEELFHLDERLQRAVAFLMNIHSRFLFEKKFYAERSTHTLTAKEITDWMLEAQNEGYANSLDQWNPMFWASKMHFYFTDVPFYNFPYTYGYLLSAGMYQQYSERDLDRIFDGLLRDSGSMTSEALIQKHLHKDIRKEAFWQECLEGIKKDAARFIELSSKLLQTARNPEFVDSH